jgi:GTP pyrophosphokinase
LIKKLIPEPDEGEEKTLTVREKKKEDSRGITIKGVDNIMFHRAKCCYPLPGEKVTGFVTRGRGVSIHTTGCPTLDTHTIDIDRLVEVEWDQGTEEVYSVKVQVLTIDKRGLLAEMSAVLSTNNVNISHLDASATHEKQARFNFMLEIRNKNQFNDTLKKISQINGVIEVRRVQA